MKNSSLLVLSLALLLSNCNQDDNEKLKEEVWQSVKSINRHWAITENMDSLGLYIHPEMIIITPDSKQPLQGKSKIIESYKSYADYAETVSLKENNPLIQLHGNNKTAVVAYDYELTIKIPSGEEQFFTGRDMYILIHDNDKWIAISQHYSPYPK